MPWLRWLLPALLYVAAVFHRVAPGTLATELHDEFGTTTTLLALLSAAYYAVYAVLLIPVGILLDAYGPRHVVAAGGCLMGLGTLAMAEVSTGPALFASRVLISAGASVTFLGAVKAAAVWLPPAHFALATALTGAMGTAGAMLATRPLAQASSSAIGWRGALFVLGLVSAGLALMAWPLLARAPLVRPGATRERAVGALLRVVRETHAVFSSSATWWLCLSYVCVYSWWGGIGLWIAPYLRDVYGLSSRETGAYTILPFLAFLVAAPCVAHLSDRLRRRRAVYLAMLVGVLGSWTTFVWSLGHLDLGAVRWLLVLFGAFGSASVLAWATGREINPPGLAGVAVAVVTLVGFLGVALTQAVVGVVIDALSGEGARRSLGAYHAAFTLYGLLALAGTLAAAAVPETYGRNVSAR